MMISFVPDSRGMKPKDELVASAVTTPHARTDYSPATNSSTATHPYISCGDILSGKFRAQFVQGLTSLISGLDWHLKRLFFMASIQTSTENSHRLKSPRCDLAKLERLVATKFSVKITAAEIRCVQTRSAVATRSNTEDAAALQVAISTKRWVPQFFELVRHLATGHGVLNASSSSPSIHLNTISPSDVSATYPLNRRSSSSMPSLAHTDTPHI